MNVNYFEYDIIVIGGGTAGLVTAVSAGKKLSNSGVRIAVIEKEFKLGKKLLATGNGRCNMTNTNMSADFYNKSSREFVKSVLAKYSSDKIISFFNSIGLICKPDSFGRVYPYSGQASAVLDVLMLNLELYGVDIYCETKINSIEKTSNGYKITGKKSVFTAQKVILATGGKVQPSLGSDGSSYKFAEDLQLKCSPVFPSLAPIPCSNKNLPIVKGVRILSDVSLIADGEIIHTESGELQLNEKNISGICVFQLSRFVNEYFTNNSINGKSYSRISVTADFMPDYTADEIEHLLVRKRKLMGGLSVEELFTGIINKKLGIYLLKNLDIDTSNREIYSLTDDELQQLAYSVKSCEFYPSGLSGINSAQVTGGGIDINEIDRSMQSFKHKDLYIIGEALDVDGLCGGYNLHWAFAGGIIAGNAVADSYKNKDKNKKRKGK